MAAHAASAGLPVGNHVKVSAAATQPLQAAGSLGSTWNLGPETNRTSVAVTATIAITAVSSPSYSALQTFNRTVLHVQTY